MSNDWEDMYSGATPWVLVSRTGGGRTLTLNYMTFTQTGPVNTNIRDRLDAVEVRESADAVSIEIRQTVQSRAGVRVSFITTPVSVNVTLRQPLAKRKLIVDGDLTKSEPLSNPQSDDGAPPLSGVGDGLSSRGLWR